MNRWRPISDGSNFYAQRVGSYDVHEDSRDRSVRYRSIEGAKKPAKKLNAQSLTFEEFVWRSLWLDIGRMDQYVSPFYTRKAVRKLIKRAKREELWEGPFFEKSEWAGMVQNWYAHYLKTGEL